MPWRRKSEWVTSGREAVVKLGRERRTYYQRTGKIVQGEYGHTVDKSPPAKAMFYMYTRFEQLSGYVNDAQFCIDNNPVERSIRPLTLNRKNTLFSGSHEAAHAAAIFFSLMGCCRENKVNPKLWMQDVLIRVQEKEREEKNDYTILYLPLIGKDKQESYNKVKSQTCFVWLLTLL